MMVRLIFIVLFYSITVIDIHANTITFLHDENTQVRMQDAVYPEILDYSPTFLYPTATIFQLTESKVQFYLISHNSSQYYLWIENLSTNIEIDLSDPQISASDFVLIPKSNWPSGKLNYKNSTLKKLNELDLFYHNALDSLNKLAQNTEQYRAEMDFNNVVWDGRSAKRLYNLAVEKFSYQFDEKWIHYVPAYNEYWQFMYTLYYQYFHKNSFKGLNKYEIKSRIQDDFNSPESKLLVFHYFFRVGLSLNELKENYEFLKGDLDLREQNLAEAFIQRQAIKDLSINQRIDFLFGIDIDGAMEGYFTRDSTEKKNVVLFWSTWDGNMATEFNLLADLKEDFETQYNFIHICIDAFETPDKTKSFIYQNRVGGFHLLPEQSNAFRSSDFRKNQKIRDFPFYLVTDNSGEVLETESIPLEISNRLESKLKHFRTKK